MRVIDDTNLPSKICTMCARISNVDKHTCQAFPDGIPDIIWDGRNDHTTPVKGDGGLMFVWANETPETTEREDTDQGDVEEVSA